VQSESPYLASREPWKAPGGGVILLPVLKRKVGPDRGTLTTRTSNRDNLTIFPLAPGPGT
jgi:hypothetical protein